MARFAAEAPSLRSRKSRGFRLVTPVAGKLGERPGPANAAGHYRQPTRETLPDINFLAHLSAPIPLLTSRRKAHLSSDGPRICRVVLTPPSRHATTGSHAATQTQRTDCTERSPQKALERHGGARETALQRSRAGRAPAMLGNCFEPGVGEQPKTNFGVD